MITQLRLTRLVLTDLEVKEVAQELGINRTYLCSLETGAVRGHDKWRYALADFFGVPEPNLFDARGHSKEAYYFPKQEKLIL